MTDPAALEADARKNAGQPARAITHHDLQSVFVMIAALANIIGQQASRISVLEAKRGPGRPPKI